MREIMSRVRNLVLLGLGVFLLGIPLRGYADETSYQKLLEAYQTSPGLQALVAPFLPEIQKNLDQIVYDQTGLERDVDGKIEAFRQQYTSLYRELKYKQLPPYRDYDPNKKMCRRIQFNIMYAMATAEDSIYAEVHEDVVDELGPIDELRQLTYEPAVSEMSPLYLAVPLTALVLVAIGSETKVLTGKTRIITTILIVGFLTLPGCATISKWFEDHGDDIIDILKEVLKLWIQIEMNRRKIKDRIRGTVDDFETTLERVKKVEFEIKDYTKSQLYVAIFLTVVDFLHKYFNDQEFQEKTNAAYKKKHALRRELVTGEEGAIGAEEFVDSIQVKVIWEYFEEMIKKYVSDPVIRDAILKASAELKKEIVGLLKRTYEEYKAELEIIKGLIEKIKDMQKDDFTNRDEDNQEEYLKKLKAWKGAEKAIWDQFKVLLKAHVADDALELAIATAATGTPATKDSVLEYLFKPTESASADEAKASELAAAIKTQVETAQPSLTLDAPAIEKLKKALKGLKLWVDRTAPATTEATDGTVQPSVGLSEGKPWNIGDPYLTPAEIDYVNRD